jgi:hypothetical protein
MALVGSMPEALAIPSNWTNSLRERFIYFPPGDFVNICYKLSRSNIDLFSRELL